MLCPLPFPFALLFAVQRLKLFDRSNMGCTSFSFSRTSRALGSNCTDGFSRMLLAGEPCKPSVAAVVSVGAPSVESVCVRSDELCWGAVALARRASSESVSDGYATQSAGSLITGCCACSVDMFWLSFGSSLVMNKSSGRIMTTSSKPMSVSLPLCDKLPDLLLNELVMLATLSFRMTDDADDRTRCSFRARPVMPGNGSTSLLQTSVNRFSILALSLRAGANTGSRALVVSND